MQPVTLNTTIDVTWFFQIAFFVVLLIFILHVATLAYHWFTYGENKKLSTTALAIYLVGGAVLFLILSISITNL